MREIRTSGSMRGSLGIGSGRPLLSTLLPKERICLRKPKVKLGLKYESNYQIFDCTRWQ